jgi:predicted nucleotidyltransferase
MRSYKMLETLITSKTRIKLLLKFFLNANNTGYLKNLEQEFEDSSNGIRVELNKFEEAGLLKSETVGNKKIFKANQKHPLFLDIHSIILKYTGVDQIIETIINRLGNVNSVYLIGSLARGIESNIIDLLIIGEINKDYLISLIEKAEPLIEKKIRYIHYNTDEFSFNEKEILNQEHLLIWKS